MKTSKGFWFVSTNLAFDSTLHQPPPTGTLRAVGKAVSSTPKYSYSVLLPSKAEYLQAYLSMWQGINHSPASGCWGLWMGSLDSGFIGPHGSEDNVVPTAAIAYTIYSGGQVQF